MSTDDPRKFSLQLVDFGSWIIVNRNGEWIGYSSYHNRRMSYLIARQELDKMIADYLQLRAELH